VNLWLRFWLLLALAMLACALLGACTVIDKDVPPPADWPALAIHVHKVKGGELIKECWPAESLFMQLNGALPSGCAWINFARNRCDVYLPSYVDHDGYALNHELEHCHGYDHYGDSTMHDAWAAWKQKH